MAFTKSKSIESALKAMSQGKIANAIGEYQKILRSDPADQVTLMTLGDLFVRQGETRQAIDCFEKLAQLYLAEGFNSKAIAIYKKIGKLSPAETGPVERLAELYVQQGVMSEARPIFLQLAETHWKAGRGPQAVETLHRLLEVEPENLRVQTRLIELHQALGEKKEAAHILFEHTRRLSERGDLLEAQKQVDRALELDDGNVAGILLKAQVLAAGGHSESAIALLDKLPDAGAGGEVTSELVDFCLKSGKLTHAVDLARNAFAANPRTYALAHKVAMALLESGEADEALSLLREIREAMTEAGDHEQLGQTLATAADRLPNRLEPIEWQVSLYRRMNDSLRLPDALRKLADACTAVGEWERAESLLTELIERDPGNEELVARLNQVLVKEGREPLAAAERRSLKAETAVQVATEPIPEPLLDEETQRYVSQALTDVDLFASYGLTQKAVQLLENILRRAPHHIPTLERLLDLYIGAGNDRRTAELAAQLEQLHERRGDLLSAERFGELRRRFQRAAGLTDDELAEAAPVQPTEFGVAPDVAEPLDEPLEATPEAASRLTSQEYPETVDAALPTDVAPASPESAPPLQEASSPAASGTGASGGEVDLSEDWVALSREMIAPPSPPQSADAPLAPEPAPSSAAEFELELVPLSSPKDANASMSTEEFMKELTAEVADLQPVEAAAEPPPIAQPAVAKGAEKPESVDHLREVFQEFRSELDEMTGEDEDLETHYNLGVAYREMGLLDEAIGEFQKVAKAVQDGRPFRYAMQCSTLLGLTFMAKDEPKIATLWYQRALETPGLDQESILALRYDLGVAQELAKDSGAALESFRQVYAMNIDYRDVAERIAALVKR